MASKRKPVVRAWVSPNGKIAYVTVGRKMYAHTNILQWCEAKGVPVEMMPDAWKLPRTEANRLNAARLRAMGRKP